MFLKNSESARCIHQNGYNWWALDLNKIFDAAEGPPPSRVVIREEWLRERGEFYIRIIMKMIHINESHINVWERTLYESRQLRSIVYFINKWD